MPRSMRTTWVASATSVREMSASVQFIFITHKRSTMELASQLVGVTMNETRRVTARGRGLDEAVRMAAM